MRNIIIIAALAATACRIDDGQDLTPPEACQTTTDAVAGMYLRCDLGDWGDAAIKVQQHKSCNDAIGYDADQLEQCILDTAELCSVNAPTSCAGVVTWRNP